MKWEKVSQDTAKRLEALIQPFASQKKYVRMSTGSTVICSQASSRAASFSGCRRRTRKSSWESIKIPGFSS
jgi:hypothetical protein